MCSVSIFLMIGLGMGSPWGGGPTPGPHTEPHNRHMTGGHSWADHPPPGGSAAWSSHSLAAKSIENGFYSDEDDDSGSSGSDSGGSASSDDSTDT